MGKIYKYEKTISDRITIEVPDGSIFLDCLSQSKNNISFYFIVDTSFDLKDYVFRIFGTGHEVSHTILTHYDFVKSTKDYDGFFVWHVFKCKK